MQRLVSGVVLREGQILLVRRKPGETLAGRWTLPEGELRPGECWITALVAAVHAETRLVVTVSERTAIPHLAGPWPGLRAVCHLINREPEVRLGERLDAFRWVTLRELSSVADLVPLVDEEVVMALEAGLYGAL